MLEQPTLLLRSRTDGAGTAGRVWIVHPVTGELLGSAGRRGKRGRLPWLTWLEHPLVEVRESDDEPLLCTLQRTWSLWSNWRVADADGFHVGRVSGPFLLDRKGRQVAVRREEVASEKVSYQDPARRDLAVTQRDRAGVRLTFLPDGEGNPFVKMLLLAAALIHNERILGKL